MAISRTREKRRVAGPGRVPGNTRGGGRPPIHDRALRFLSRVSSERGALAVALLLAFLFTGFNMAKFPNYELDEGTYMGSAWSMFNEGQLSYYTYTYDHPVFGWFQVGAWAELVGGFLSFGTSIDTGRVLMLLVAVASTFLIFKILRVATRSVAAAFSGPSSSPSRRWASCSTGRCGSTT